MESIVKLFSIKKGEIYKFLNKYYDNHETNHFHAFDSSLLEWETSYKNPVDMADIIGVFIENKDNYLINMWISLDEDILINITDNNADEIIKYLYERYPY